MGSALAKALHAGAPAASSTGSNERRMARLFAPCGMLTSMKGGFNLVMGLVALAAGASGQFALPGTSSPLPLEIAGGAVAALGLIQLVRSRRQP